MRKIFSYTFLIFIIIFLGAQPIQAHAWRMHARRYRLALELPASMRTVEHIKDSMQGEIYYDTTSHIIMMISGRASKFEKVDDYISCSMDDLDNNMRRLSGDSTFTIIDCVHNDKATVLHYQAYNTDSTYNENIVYFIHHRKKDIQIAFAYSASDSKACIQKITRIMETLDLKN